MDCREITEASVALQIMQSTGDNRLQKLFNCIYTLFQGSFLNWVLNMYKKNPYKEKLWEDAKDAFQNGILALYRKSQNKNFQINGSLKTTIYSFGLLQLLALFKNEKSFYGSIYYLKVMESAFEDDYFKNEKQEFLSRKEQDLMEALNTLQEKQRAILIMKFFNKMKSKEIADKLAVTVGDVDNNASKAYKELRRILKSKPGFQN